MRHTARAVSGANERKDSGNARVPRANNFKGRILQTHPADSSRIPAGNCP